MTKRQIIRSNKVLEWEAQLLALDTALYRQYAVGFTLLKNYGDTYDDTDPELATCIKHISQSKYPMSEIRVQGTARGTWRAFRVLAIHHNDTIIVATIAGDKHQRPDWYDQAVTEAEHLYEEWMKQQ